MIYSLQFTDGSLNNCPEAREWLEAVNTQLLEAQRRFVTELTAFGSASLELCASASRANQRSAGRERAGEAVISYWWEMPCPTPHPPGHCRLCLTYQVDVDGQRWALPDDAAQMTAERARRIVSQRSAQDKAH